MKSKSMLILLAVSVFALCLAACGPSVVPTPTPTATPAATATAVPPTATARPSATSVPPTATPPPTGTLTRVPSPTTTRTATPSAKDMMMATFNTGLAKIKGYRVKIPDEGREVDVLMPDRLLQLGMDPVMMIGRTVYMLDARGNLRVVNMGNMTAPLDRANLNWQRDQFAQATQVVAMGPATIDGVPCVGYTATLVTQTKMEPVQTPGATPVLTKVTAPVKIYFGSQDGFPRKIELGAPTPSTIIFYDFNQDIAPIEPPNK